MQGKKEQPSSELRNYYLKEYYLNEDYSFIDGYINITQTKRSELEGQDLFCKLDEYAFFARDPRQQ